MRTTIDIGDIEPAPSRVRAVHGGGVQAEVDLDAHAELLALMDEL